MRCRDLCYDLFQDFFYIKSCFSRNSWCIMGFKADDIFDFIYHTIRFCTWQVDFVDNWKDIQVMVKGKIYICQCLGFDSLSCIYYQDCTVAGCKASGYFVIEVYMARGCRSG